MVDLTTIEEKINFGSGIAARVIGQAVTQYRAQNIQSPLDISGYVAIFYAAFDSDPLLTLKKPIKVGRDVFYMIANTSTLAVGDYIVGPEGTFFVASLEPMRPPVVIRTNAVLSLVRPQSTSVAGLGPPGADSASTETTVFFRLASICLNDRKRRPGGCEFAGGYRYGRVANIAAGVVWYRDPRFRYIG